MGKRRLNRAEIKTPMLGELLVLTGNHRDFQVVGNLVPWPPAALQVDRLAVEPGFDLAFDHQRRPWWWHDAKHQYQQNAANCEPEQGFGETTKK